MSVSNDIYKFFADYIYNHTGITYLEKDYYRLDSRFKDLISVFELSTVEELYALYKGSITPDMHAVLINFSTNNETYFFRDNKPFKALTSLMLPELAQKYTMGLFNIWSCAASTGQESYSILMSINDMKDKSFFPRVMIEASDISKTALDKAKKGIYNGLDVQRGLPITTLMKYFEQLPDENWEVSKELRSKIKFFEFNLLSGNFKENNYHIIFCRNVLIYQDKDNKEVILNNITKALKPGGFLVLGNGESLIGLNVNLKRVTHDGLTIYQKNEQRIKCYKRLDQILKDLVY